MRVRVTILVLMLFAVMARAEEQPYLCELGFQGGCGYYVGDASPHIFMHPREAYGVHFRYKFTKRWAIQAKVSGQRITGKDCTIRGEQLDTKWQTQLVNVDVMAEFNFFRFGTGNKFDKRNACIGLCAAGNRVQVEIFGALRFEYRLAAQHLYG